MMPHRFSYWENKMTTTISPVLDMFEKLATNAHHIIAFDDMIKAQAIKVQQAFSQNDSRALKSLFCNPAELADKTTVFQA
jgi:hypothetical protein